VAGAQRFSLGSRPGFPRNWRELRRNSTKASAAIAMLALGYCLFAILAVVLLSAKGLARL
jgi:hypothetical protein